jgi:DNA-binding response OmpR family regulator
LTDKRLLVVDDEPEFGEFVRKVAAASGFEVEVTSDAAAFKTVYDAFDPTVVVLDVVMPDVDGLELVKWLAERKSTVHLIVVTGYNPDYSEYARKIGGARGLQRVTNLAKPVALAVLRAALDDSGDA